MFSIAHTHYLTDRLVENEESINSLKKLQRRSSASSMLFGQRQDDPPMDSTSTQDTNRPSSLNVQLPLNSHLPPISLTPSGTPTGMLLSINNTPTSSLGEPSPAYSQPTVSFPRSDSSLSISMQIEAKWLPLSSYSHPYFRIVRPGKYLRKGHHYEVSEIVRDILFNFRYLSISMSLLSLHRPQTACLLVA